MNTTAPTPTDRILAGSLVLAPLTYLLADSLYAARGWDDSTAAVFHVLGAIGYTFVFLCVVVLLRDHPNWSAAVLVTGMVGVAGNVAYGFNTIHVSLGGVDLVDADGAATLIKPLGLVFVLALLLTAIGLAVTGTAPRWAALLIGVAAVAWPASHIPNIAWLAVLTQALLLVGFGGVYVAGRARVEPRLAAAGVAS